MHHKSAQSVRYKTPKEIPLVFHFGSNYDKHFIIKELAEEFKTQFECLEWNTVKYIIISVSIKKEIENCNTITNKIKFIYSVRCMLSSLSSPADNISKL